MTLTPLILTPANTRGLFVEPQAQRKSRRGAWPC